MISHHSCYHSEDDQMMVCRFCGLAVCDAEGVPEQELDRLIAHANTLVCPGRLDLLLEGLTAAQDECMAMARRRRWKDFAAASRRAVDIATRIQMFGADWQRSEIRTGKRDD